MTDRVNGSTFAGEFLTGNMDFFTLLTLVPVGQTNVVTPVVDLPSYQTYASTGVWTTVSVTDSSGTATSYATLNAYLDAFYKQTNLDNLIRTFSGRANPVAISVNSITGNIPGTATAINANTTTLWAFYGLYNNIATPTQVFGSAYTTGKTFYSVHVATEKTLLWTAGTNSNFSTSTAADNTNAQGYNILASNSSYQGLDGLTAYDTQSAQVLSGSAQGSDATNYYYLKNTVQPYVTTWNTSSATLTNTMAAQGFVLNTVGV
jgi:hypothetical protein